jgi:uncharacterized protein YjbI with pentapeptide repeats
MANDEHVAMLKQGVTAWNAWRDENSDIRPDLCGADLCRADFVRADFSRADLSGAQLAVVKLREAKLSGAARKIDSTREALRVSDVARRSELQRPLAALEAELDALQ